ncbi:MAG: hypothetical protein J0L73_28460 [Verrucomicrobia bacterium]|nr:hypothetical protein [Verrucomicrobiota bacterium]
MSFPTTVTNTGANLTTQSAANAAQLWKEGADMYEATEDVFTKMEGGPESLIQIETDLAAGSGQKITFRQKSGFYGPGRSGNNLYTDASHFEEIMMGTNTLQVGLMRNATSTFFMMEEDLGMRGDLESGLNEELGKWMGREKTSQMGLSLLHQCDLSNHLTVNSRGDIQKLVSGDGLSPDDLVTAGAMLESMGGKPAMIGKDHEGNDVFSLVFLTTQFGSASIEVDPDYKARLLAIATQNGMQNALVQGGLIPVSGHHVKKWRVVDHDGVGPIGSFLNPKASLGIAIVDGTTADLTGGGRGITGGGDATSAAKTIMQYFRDFPRYAIAFCNGETVAATASTHQLITGNKFYVTIVNPPTAAVDPNKWCIYRCTVNNGNELTVDARLSTVANNGTGIAVSTLGGVTWDDTLNTTVHPEGALVYASNEIGKPMFKTIGLGMRAARRGYGKFRNQRMIQLQEGGAIKETYIASIFGQKPRADRRGKFPGVIVLNHTGTYPGWKHP